MLLDTHVWVWAAERDTRRLGRRTLGAIERAHAQDAVHVSAMSVFEIAALYVSGRLTLQVHANQWVERSLQSSRIHVLDISVRAATAAGLIPGPALPDPCDRLIAGTALETGLPLVTRDERLLAYAERTLGLRVVDARL